jgi:hypothetical protein
MSINIELKIKMKDGKEIVLESNEAKELYEELKKIYNKDYISYPYLSPTYIPVYDPIPWNKQIIWGSSNGNSIINYKTDGRDPNTVPY